MYVNFWCLGDIEFLSCLFEDDFAKNDTHGDFHEDVYIYVNRDFNKVDKVHNEFGAWEGFDEDMEASKIIEEESFSPGTEQASK